MYQSLSPARFESLIREYLHGSHLQPLGLRGRLQAHGQAATQRVAAEQAKARRHLQRK
jgi:hypothetical protein